MQSMILSVLAATLVLLSPCSIGAQAQRTASGTVMNSAQEPIRNVKIKLWAHGSVEDETASGADGSYLLNIPDTVTVFSITYRGLRREATLRNLSGRHSHSISLVLGRAESRDPCRCSRALRPEPK